MSTENIEINVYNVLISTFFAMVQNSARREEHTVYDPFKLLNLLSQLFEDAFFYRFVYISCGCTRVYSVHHRESKNHFTMYSAVYLSRNSAHKFDNFSSNRERCIEVLMKF